MNWTISIKAWKEEHRGCVYRYPLPYSRLHPIEAIGTKLKTPDMYRLTQNDISIIRKWVPDCSLKNIRLDLIEPILIQHCNVRPQDLKSLGMPTIINLLKKTLIDKPHPDQKSTKNKVDMLVEKLKNHWIIALILIIAMVVVGLGTFTDNLDKILYFIKKYFVTWGN